MVLRNEVLSYLESVLDCGAFQDYCVNGLQVEGRERVERIAVGVSASMRFFQEAQRWGADLLIVHHGLFWKSTPHPFALTGVLRNRVAFLIEHGLNLAAYHLPLDAHPEIGNNARILSMLGARDPAPVEPGLLGRFEPAVEVRELAARVQAWMSRPVVHLAYGPATVRTAAVISGAASTLVEVVAARGAEAFITGDLAEQVPRLAEELGIHLFALGHYDSERFGIIALGDRLHERFDLPVRFFEVENPA